MPFDIKIISEQFGPWVALICLLVYVIIKARADQSKGAAKPPTDTNKKPDEFSADEKLWLDREVTKPILKEMRDNHEKTSDAIKETRHSIKTDLSKIFLTKRDD